MLWGGGNPTQPQWPRPHAFICMPPGLHVDCSLTIISWVWMGGFAQALGWAQVYSMFFLEPRMMGHQLSGHVPFSWQVTGVQRQANCTSTVTPSVCIMSSLIPLAKTSPVAEPSVGKGKARNNSSVTQLSPTSKI